MNAFGVAIELHAGSDEQQWWGKSSVALERGPRATAFSLSRWMLRLCLMACVGDEVQRVPLA